MRARRIYICLTLLLLAFGIAIAGSLRRVEPKQSALTFVGTAGVTVAPLASSSYPKSFSEDGAGLRCETKVSLAEERPSVHKKPFRIDMT